MAARSPMRTSNRHRVAGIAEDFCARSTSRREKFEAIFARYSSIGTALRSTPIGTGVRMVAATFQPRFAKWSAVDLPRPLLVPAMNYRLIYQ
jgi:hypothetical protein